VGPRYPRGAHEAGDHEAVGDRRVVGLARVGYLIAGFADLEAQAVEDLGGEANLSALRREVLAIGLSAEGIALLTEFASKIHQSKAAGRTPGPSRYRATHVIATFLDLVARRFRDVGLDRRARSLGYIDSMLARQAGRGRTIGSRGRPRGRPGACSANGRRPGLAWRLTVIDPRGFKRFVEAEIVNEFSRPVGDLTKGAAERLPGDFLRR
jgi:hypothetical protein